MEMSVMKPKPSTVPDVPFEMLAGLPLTAAEWRTIATRASWQQTRMSLNLFARHGVFGDHNTAWEAFKARFWPADFGRAMLGRYDVLLLL